MLYSTILIMLKFPLISNQASFAHIKFPKYQQDLANNNRELVEKLGKLIQQQLETKFNSIHLLLQICEW